MMTGAFPIERSNLYTIWLEEQEHIAKNKWYLSERVGYSVSYETAKHDWYVRYRPKWIAELKASGKYPT